MRCFLILCVFVVGLTLKGPGHAGFDSKSLPTVDSKAGLSRGASLSSPEVEQAEKKYKEGEILVSSDRAYRTKEKESPQKTWHGKAETVR